MICRANEPHTLPPCESGWRNPAGPARTSTSSRPISSFANPSAANNSSRAWRTARCGNDGDDTIASNASRCCSVRINAGAAPPRIASMIPR